MELKGRITVYSIEGCLYCRMAKNSLQEKGLPFTDVNLDAHPDLQYYIRERTGRATVPQVFFNNIHIGGNNELQEKLSNKQAYEQLLDEVRCHEVPPDGPKLPGPASAALPDHMDFTREPDEYAKLVTDFKKSGVIKNHTFSISDVCKNSFTGQDFVDWLMKTKSLGKDTATLTGQELVNRKFCHVVVGSSRDFPATTDTLYRLLQDEDTNALNGGEMNLCKPRKATEVAEDMRSFIIKLYAAFLSPDGKRVDYNGIKGSPEFKKYVSLTKELVRADVETLTREEKLAFFINIYNALVIHGTIKCGHPSNGWQIDRFFGAIKYIIGGHQYSLDDVENGVLRANRNGAGKKFKPFEDKDPRMKVALKEPEPLIHFALVCGAKSCPPIKTFSPQGIMDQLTLAAEAFLEDEYSVSVDLANNVVTVSQLFEWYREDFGHDDKAVLEFIQAHVGNSDKKTQLGNVLERGKYSFKYHHYDWSINS